MAEFNVNGVIVEIDGVDRNELPNAFDFSELWRLSQNGQSVDKMEEYVHAQRWVESSRSRVFWDEWHGR